MIVEHQPVAHDVRDERHHVLLLHVPAAVQERPGAGAFDQGARGARAGPEGDPLANELGRALLLRPRAAHEGDDLPL